VKAVREEVRAALLAGEITAPVAADRILAAYDAGE
jgi:LAO/AO transport system kinase